MDNSDSHLSKAEPPAVADIVGPLLRDGLVPAVVDSDLLILDADANQVVRIACADASIGGITAILDTQGLLATTADNVLDGDLTASGFSRRRMLQGAAVAGVVGVTVLTLPSAAMAQSAGPSAPQNVTAEPGDTEVTVRWNPVPGTGITYTVYYRQAGQTLFTDTTSTADTALTVNGLSNDLVTEFYVVASPGGGQSPTVTATPTANAWTSVAATAADWLGIATDGSGTWVSVGEDKAMRSTDNGITWPIPPAALVALGPPLDPARQYAASTVGFGTDRFVVARVLIMAETDPDDEDLTTEVVTSSVAYSDDGGATWTLVNDVPPGGWTDVVYGNGIWVAVADQTTENQVMTSSNNGETWTPRPAPSASWQSVAYGDGIWVAVASIPTESPASVMRSTDGVTWSDDGVDADLSSWRSVAFGNGWFVALAENGAVMRSTDGLEWTRVVEVLDDPVNPWKSLATNGLGTWVAVTTNLVLRSTDNGATWFAESPAAVNEWRDVEYGSSRFVAVAYNPTVPPNTSVMYRA